MRKKIFGGILLLLVHTHLFAQATWEEKLGHQLEALEKQKKHRVENSFPPHLAFSGSNIGGGPDGQLDYGNWLRYQDRFLEKILEEHELILKQKNNHRQAYEYVVAEMQTQLARMEDYRALTKMALERGQELIAAWMSESDESELDYQTMYGVALKPYLLMVKNVVVLMEKQILGMISAEANKSLSTEHAFLRAQIGLLSWIENSLIKESNHGVIFIGHPRFYIQGVYLVTWYLAADLYRSSWRSKYLFEIEDLLQIRQLVEGYLLGDRTRFRDDKDLLNSVHLKVKRIKLSLAQEEK